jgi:quinolinate synthase
MAKQTDYERSITQIQQVKQKLGKELLILAHHYQRDDVVDVADVSGDSLQLSQKAASTDASYIVFCGVRFMAETAAILARPDQTVLSPQPYAGCFLADQASQDQVELAWKKLSGLFPGQKGLVPVTYVNSSSSIKEFVGRHGGAICTSSNAGKVMNWALQRHEHLLFLPDQHLGRNTAHSMGISDKNIAMWDPRFPPTDLNPLAEAPLILWRGACNVHMRLLLEDVLRVREVHPEARVIVHPECRESVVEIADEAGSTAKIVRAIEQSSAGSTWAVGTEEHLVSRLRTKHPDKKVLSLSDPPPYCTGMSMTKISHLARLLTGILENQMLGKVELAQDVISPAREAVLRMLDITK